LSAHGKLNQVANCRARAGANPLRYREDLEAEIGAPCALEPTAVEIRDCPVGRHSRSFPAAKWGDDLPSNHEHPAHPVESAQAHEFLLYHFMERA
jgi:hypothetical protein